MLEVMVKMIITNALITISFNRFNLNSRLTTNLNKLTCITQVFDPDTLYILYVVQFHE